MPRRTKREQVRSEIRAYALWSAIAERDLRAACREIDLSQTAACAHVSAYLWREFEVSKRLRQNAGQCLVNLGALRPGDI